MIGTKIYKADFDEVRYAELAAWCNQNNAKIEERTDCFEAVSLPEKTLEERKEEAAERLWNNYKSYQRAQVDPEDLTLAALCASNGSLKGKGVQGWVMMLWEQYYSVRDEINAAATPEALEAINLAADVCGNPPYTIRELNEEAAAFMAGTNGV
jgi:hypothetical protein